jgi:hypothetical protein
MEIYQSKLETAELSDEQWLEMEKLAATGEWLDHLPPETLNRFMGQWIAVKDKQVVASAKSYALLSQKLEQLGIKSFGVRKVEGSDLVIYGTD